MNIKVYNGLKLVYQGNASAWLEENEFDTDVARMLYETYHTGSCREFWASGEWYIMKEEV